MLRTWEEKDLEQIALLEQKCFPKSAWSLQQIIQTYLSGNFYGVLQEENGVLQGYLGAVLNAWEAEIAFVCVDFDFRKKGIATNLINRLIEFVKDSGRDKIFLEVRLSNRNAINLYTKLGFKTYAQRKNYYEGTEDAICMVLSVNE